MVLFDKFVVPAKKQIAAVPQYAEYRKNYVQSLASFEKSDCQSSSKIKELLVASLHRHSGKIGLILPLSGELAKAGAEVLNGVKAGLDGDMNHLILRDDASLPTQTEAIFHELILKEQVGLVIAGLQSVSATRLAFLAEQYAVPVILLTPSSAEQKQRFSVNIFPAPHHLAQPLVDAMQKRAITSFATLAPMSSFHDSLVQQLKEESEKRGIRSVREARYTPADFASMEKAVKDLLKIDSPERAGELQSAMQEARARARRLKVKFNPDLVILPAIVDFDALFIPDNFKNTRHLVQLLKYHGIKELKVFGAHEWRSEGIVSPWDSFLQGAFFADFIRQYHELPAVLAPPQTSGLFAKTSELASLDYRMVGWRAATIIASAWSPTVKRYAGGQLLRRSTNKVPGYFPPGANFDELGRVRWPSFTFALMDKTIVVDP